MRKQSVPGSLFLQPGHEAITLVFIMCRYIHICMNLYERMCVLEVPIAVRGPVGEVLIVAIT